MSFAYICRTYKVPAREGGRVEYTGGSSPALGTITGAEGHYLLVRLDRSMASGLYHPTWAMRYLDEPVSSLTIPVTPEGRS